MRWRGIGWNARGSSLLIKPVTTIEAVGRQLDPTFKSLSTPRRSSSRSSSRNTVLRRWRSARPTPGGSAERASTLRPTSLNHTKDPADGMQMQFVHGDLDFVVREMDRSSNRLSFAVVIATIVIGSSIIVHASVGPQGWVSTARSGRFLRPAYWESDSPSESSARGACDSVMHSSTRGWLSNDEIWAHHQPVPHVVAA
jgi:hypothetical protein